MRNIKIAIPIFILVMGLISAGLPACSVLAPSSVLDVEVSDLTDASNGNGNIVFDYINWSASSGTSYTEEGWIDVQLSLTPETIYVYDHDKNQFIEKEGAPAPYVNINKVHVRIWPYKQTATGNSYYSPTAVSEFDFFPGAKQVLDGGDFLVRVADIQLLGAARTIYAPSGFLDYEVTMTISMDSNFGHGITLRQMFLMRLTDIAN